MAIEESKLKLAKRKLRVERCKTRTASSMPKTPHVRDGESAANPKSKPATNPAKDAPRPSTLNSRSHPPIKVPKGDPGLGDKLRGLDKDARRSAKAADPARQARRMAKKKARRVLEDGGVGSGGGNSKGGVLGNMRKLGKPKIKAKVSRVRGEKSAARRNGKK